MPSISTKRSDIPYLKLLNTRKTTAYGVEDPGHGSGHGQNRGGIISVNMTFTL